MEFNSTHSHAGGTIGLFTGLSLISMVEIVYWMIKVREKSSTFTASF